MEDEKIINLLKEYQSSPFRFFEDAYGLTPQKPKPHARARMQMLFLCPPSMFNSLASTFTLSDFEEFEKGKELTWQQSILLIAIQRAYTEKDFPKKIAVKSGRGLGKSFSVSSIFPWHLYSFKDARAMCTAPTADQMDGAILAELARNLNNMNDVFKKMFTLSADKLSRNDNPKDIWARFRTASKERPEALSGVHSKWLLAVADEASAVADEVLNNADDTLTEQTGANVMVLITNPTRTSGYFFDIFYDKDNKPNTASDKYWVKLTFNALESPIFSKAKAEEALIKYGSAKHPEYMSSILGEFPLVDMVDKDGWYRMFDNETIDNMFLPKGEEPELLGNVILGADPSGGGEDDASIYVRSARVAKLEHREKISDEYKISEDIARIVDKYRISDGDSYYDNFNIGANIGKILYQKYSVDAVGVNSGENCKNEEDNKKYLNIRAMLADRLLNWYKIGGRIVYSEQLKKELQSIFVRRTDRGQLQVMTKKEMRKRGYKSPNLYDSLSYTFYNDDPHNPYIGNGGDAETVYYGNVSVVL